MTQASTTIRVSLAQRDRLRELAAQREQSMSETLDRALEALRRDTFYRSMADAESALRADPDGWAAYESGRDSWLNARIDEG